jgi:hypothetical protein
MKPKDAFAVVKQFDSYPDDMVLGPMPTAILLGITERTLRATPPIPKRRITLQKVGYRVGDIRALVRGAAA